MDNEKTGEMIKPIAPFRKIALETVFGEFVDLNSKNGNFLKGQHY